MSRKKRRDLMSRTATGADGDAVGAFADFMNIMIAAGFRRACNDK